MFACVLAWGEWGSHKFPLPHPQFSPNLFSSARGFSPSFTDCVAHDGFWFRVCRLLRCRVHVQNRHLELMQLRTLQQLEVPFDIAFFVAQRLRELKQEDKATRVEGGTAPTSFS